MVFRVEQLPIMTEFYNNMNASELMWLIRIIMRRMIDPFLKWPLKHLLIALLSTEMKVGATEKTFFE